MKTRILSLSLIGLALVLVVVTIAIRGNPMGYRGHQAVIQEVVGVSELRIEGARPERPKPGQLIGYEHELRTSTYSSVALGAPAGTLTIFDSSSLRTRKKQGPADPAWQLVSGRIRVDVDGQRGMTLGQQVSDVYLEMLPGAFFLNADGKGLLAGTVLDGTLLLHEAKGRPTEIKPGQFFVLSPLSPVVVNDGVPPLELTAELAPRTKAGELPTVNGRVTPGGRVYINGELHYPDTSGEFVAALHPGSQEAVILAEDIAGNAVRKVLPVGRWNEPTSPPQPQPAR
ncbi:MAG: hypothetical protein JXR83_02495 [Deltaproteobacteria bacterium]|nr:hypothetical protein [Deltaproteobacteria bacterium]